MKILFETLARPQVRRSVMVAVAAVIIIGFLREWSNPSERFKSHQPPITIGANWPSKQ